MNYKNLTKRLFIYALTLAMVLSFVPAFGFDSQAKTTIKTKKTKLKSTVVVGDTRELYEIQNLRINGKLISDSSLEGKIKAYKTATHSDETCVYTKVTKDGVDEESVISVIYVADTFDYELEFLVTGTFTVTYTHYVECTAKYNEKTKKTTYGAGYEETVTDTYVALNTEVGIKSVKFGTGLYTSDLTAVDSSRTSVTKKYPFVTGKKAKLKVTAGAKCKINSIVIGYSDKKGKFHFKSVKNGAKVPVSQYKEDGGSVKLTMVYVGFKNTVTGEYTKFSVNKKGEIITKNKVYGYKATSYKGPDLSGNTSEMFFFYTK